jgi:hypothetical protein
MDDIVVCSKTVHKQAERLRNVLQRFAKANLQLQAEKCVFARSEVQYLGFFLSERRVAASPDKFKAVKKLQNPHKRPERSCVLRLGLLL